jgi:hypothetical protein
VGKKAEVRVGLYRHGDGDGRGGKAASENGVATRASAGSYRMCDCCCSGETRRGW